VLRLPSSEYFWVIDGPIDDGCSIVLFCFIFNYLLIYFCAPDGKGSRPPVVSARDEALEKGARRGRKRRSPAAATCRRRSAQRSAQVLPACQHSWYVIINRYPKKNEKFFPSLLVFGSLSREELLLK
jgi:hypothetical protein